MIGIRQFLKSSIASIVFVRLSEVVKAKVPDAIGDTIGLHLSRDIFGIGGPFW